MPERVKPIFNQISKYKYVLLVIAVGLILIVWPNAPPAAEAGPEPAAETEQSDEQALERQLESALEQVDGVGRVSVLLTRKHDTEIQYAVDQDVQDKRQWSGGALQSYEQDTRSTTVMRQDAGGGEQPLVKGRIYPVYQGALIVCDGAGDAEVRVRVLEAVGSLTGLGYDKISVVRMKP